MTRYWGDRWTRRLGDTDTWRWGDTGTRRWGNARTRRLADEEMHGRRAADVTRTEQPAPLPANEL